MNILRQFPTILKIGFTFFVPALYAKALWAQASKGANIQLQIKPYTNQWLYVAYYYGSIKALADSIYLNAESKGSLVRKTPLPQGVYILASPSKSILCEFLLDDDQQFSISADTTNLQGSLSIVGSEENARFNAYTAFVNPRMMAIDSLRKLPPDNATQSASASNKKIDELAKEIMDYRARIQQTHPGSLLALLFYTMDEIVYPPALRHPISREDSLAQYRYGKEHYWDRIDLMDGRLVRTPVFEKKLKNYLEQWVSPEPDSIIAEFNWMIALGRNDEEMYKYLVSYFVDNYIYPKYMGQDKVFLHVYQTQIDRPDSRVNWLNESQQKSIRERALMIMANQLGAQAWDIKLPDSSGTIQSLYNLTGAFTVVSFWDVHCGKCREEMPKLDSLYRLKWKDRSVNIYAVMVNESALAEWPAYIQKTGAGWTHVHEPTALRQQTEKEGKANFRQLYDMRSTPTLFLLDKEKKILAKNISLADLDKLLELKFASGK